MHRPSSRSWTEEYYAPILADLDAFGARHETPVADQIAAAEREEAALYDAYSDYFGYGMYIA